jgi:hypothetical protein
MTWPTKMIATPVNEPTRDAEAAAAVETAQQEITDLPTLTRDELLPDWRAAAPVLCAAGRGPLDEAVCTMLAQLLEKHGLGARVVSFDGISPAHIFGVETAGVTIVCLSYLDASSPAHMRYTIRRLRVSFQRCKFFLDAGPRWTLRQFLTQPNLMPLRRRYGEPWVFAYKQPANLNTGRFPRRCTPVAMRPRRRANRGVS